MTDGIIVETATHVFEATVEPDAPGDLERTLSLRVLSGPPMTEEEWGRLKEGVVRALIDAGNQVRGVTIIREDQP